MKWANKSGSEASDRWSQLSCLPYASSSFWTKAVHFWTKAVQMNYCVSLLLHRKHWKCVAVEYRHCNNMSLLSFSVAVYTRMLMSFWYLRFYVYSSKSQLNSNRGPPSVGASIWTQSGLKMLAAWMQETSFSEAVGVARRYRAGGFSVLRFITDFWTTTRLRGSPFAVKENVRVH